MTRKVYLNTSSFGMTAVGFILLGGLFLLRINNGGSLFRVDLHGAVIVVIGIATLWYMPLSITATPDKLCINRPLHTKIIPMSEIVSVSLYPPILKSRCLCGSNGWFGCYWGWCSRSDIGRFFAYYGCPDDCFLVELRNGRRYMLGCKDPKAMTDYINSLLIR